MYNPSSFVEDRPEVLHAFLREHPFATLISAGGGRISATHVPMLFEEGVLRCHVARANPHWRELAASPDALAVFHGPHHYITPSWYESKKDHGKVVPTWNYTAVHVWGQARIFDDAVELLALVRRLTETHEAQFTDRWSVDDAPKAYIESTLKAIVGIEISIQRLAGKAKLSQNRSVPDRLGAIAGLEELGTAESLAMAELMKGALDPPD